MKSLFAGFALSTPKPSLEPKQSPCASVGSPWQHYWNWEVSSPSASGKPRQKVSTSLPITTFQNHDVGIGPFLQTSGDPERSAHWPGHPFDVQTHDLPVLIVANYSTNILPYSTNHRWTDSVRSLIRPWRRWCIGWWTNKDKNGTYSFPMSSSPFGILLKHSPFELLFRAACLVDYWMLPEKPGRSNHSPINRLTQLPPATAR